MRGSLEPGRRHGMTEHRLNDQGQLYGFGATASGASRSISRRRTGLLSLVAAALCIALAVVIVTTLPAGTAVAAVATHGLSILIN